MSDESVEILRRKVDESNANIVKILGYLHNDTGTGEKGLIADFKSHKLDFAEFKRSYEDKELVKKTKMTMYGGLGAGIVLFFKYVFGLIMNHFHL